MLRLPALVGALPALLSLACDTAPAARAEAPAVPGPAVAVPAARVTRRAPAPAPTTDASPAAVPVDEAATVLFLDASAGKDHGRARAAALAGCAAGTDADRVRCLIRARYVRDRAAARDAERIFTAAGTVAGLEPARKMDGGWRGKLTLVPELPVGGQRHHLRWIADALEDYGKVLGGLTARAAKPLPYRFRSLRLRFFRSVRANRPSAYAWDWTVAWNVAGSLHGSADKERATLFHEIFHLNDANHRGWADRTLGKLYDGIVKRCAVGTGRVARVNACLEPYAPHHVKVYGNVYYAFHPESGVGEYAAELAVRYYQEQRAALRRERWPGQPFRCGPAENRTAWTLLATEFFGGVDLTPACPPVPRRPG